MWIKIFAAIAAVVLFVSFALPMVFKLKDVPLGIVVLVGLAMMLVDLAQSLRAKDD
jgi:hypothetical protein